MDYLNKINKNEVVVKSLDELAHFATTFFDILLKTKENKQDSQDFTQSAVVVGLSGDLGSGKTTFSKCVAQILGVNEVVTSPTFGIQKQYQVLSLEGSPFFKNFVHIDAYRIEDIKEVETLRFVELFEKPNTLIFIEWPEKIAPVLPKRTIMLSFESIDENTRKISY